MEDICDQQIIIEANADKDAIYDFNIHEKIRDGKSTLSLFTENDFSENHFCPRCCDRRHLYMSYALKVAKVKQVLSDMKSIGRKGTIWPFELLVFFFEVAIQYIHEQGEYWGIHDSLKGSYSVLKWIDYNEEEDGLNNVSGVISYLAISKWLKISEDLRQKYISNVWCGRCLGATTIKDFTVHLDKYGVILQGISLIAVIRVTRVIEE
ncbi:hypothetical protein [Paenibacillus tyrfis]|uniref:hypothetical protein n=1 Tax=Paenibacillus tyrfis TaxID=1501230 RepID=UPI00209DA2F6|nr:hypothetical protein [Paenibacillus tyrfis]MCP1309839.1 hypothetical protein [Paenibacillus tyrfis]